MRKLLSLMLVLSGLSVACGSDSKGDNPPADGDGSTDETTDPVEGDGTEDGDDGITVPDAGSPGGDGDGSDTPVKYPECPREMIPAEFDDVYEGPKPFSLEDLQACQTKCGMDQSCFTEANCPGLDAFLECINVEIPKCSFKAGGPCRVEYENITCCGAINQCQDQSCYDSKCPEDLATVQECSGADESCVVPSYRACFGDDAVGGGDGSDGADAGVAGDGGAEGNAVIRPRASVEALLRAIAR